MSIRYLIGDTRTEMAQVSTGSVSLVASSPPFMALRSYLPDDHPMKSAEIGTESDPATFLDTLLSLTSEWGRVLAPWGSIAIELGDTFAGGGGGWAGVDDAKSKNRQQYANTTPNPSGGSWPRAKSLALIPQGYAMSLAYGRNIITGEQSPAGQWLVRNVIVWHRPNPPVAALGDKFRPSTSYIVVATRSSRRFFDLPAVRTPTNAPPLDTWFDEHDTWTVTTQPSSLAHYAMWPPKLAERLILSMCPEWVCGECGEPRRRMENSVRVLSDGTIATTDFMVPGRLFGTNQQKSVLKDWSHTERTTLGWSDCGHDAYRPGVVLDPFAGTGTTLAVADVHNRDAIGIDIDERNATMVPDRLAEVKRVLFGTTPPIAGQLDLFSTNHNTIGDTHV